MTYCYNITIIQYILFHIESKILNRVCIYFANNERRSIIYDNTEIVMKTFSHKLIFEHKKYIFRISDFITIALQRFRIFEDGVQCEDGFIMSDIFLVQAQSIDIGTSTPHQ